MLVGTTLPATGDGSDTRVYGAPAAEIFKDDYAGPPVTGDAVTRALARLSRLSRAIVVLRYIEDRPVAEVAALLGCSPETGKSLASRAMGVLREDPQLRLIIAEGAQS